MLKPFGLWLEGNKYGRSVLIAAEDFSAQEAEEIFSKLGGQAVGCMMLGRYDIVKASQEIR